MHKNIAFIGGIHGVGKSTVCKAICEATDLNHLTASEVLKWKEINDKTEKNVADILHTQDRLITGLSAIVKTNLRYLLDGHYCLLNKINSIEKIPIETFKQINPFSLNVLTEDVVVVQARLEERDNKPYSIRLLNEMQDSEVFHAKEISAILNVKLNIANANDISAIISSLKHTI